MLPPKNDGAGNLAQPNNPAPSSKTAKSLHRVFGFVVRGPTPPLPDKAEHLHIKPPTRWKFWRATLSKSPDKSREVEKTEDDDPPDRRSKLRKRNVSDDGKFLRRWQERNKLRQQADQAFAENEAKRDEGNQVQLSAHLKSASEAQRSRPVSQSSASYPTTARLVSDVEPTPPLGVESFQLFRRHGRICGEVEEYRSPQLDGKTSIRSSEGLGA